MAEKITKQPITDEVATLERDIDIYAGWIKRLENPDPVLRTEAAGRGLKLYDEVERDAHTGSVLQQRILAVVGKEWEIVPAKSGRKSGRPATTTREQVVADFVSNVLENCNFEQARQEMLKAILYGYHPVEVLWQKQGDNLTIKKLIGKHPRRFIFTPRRELRLLTPSSMIEGEAVPDRKFLVYTYGDSDNPYGSGLGQKLWWPVWFKKHGVKFWMIFLEKFGTPTPVGKYPTGTLKTDQDKLLAALNAIQTDTGIIMPDTMAVSFLEASRAGTVTHEQLCEYMDRQISKAILGQTASTEGTQGKLGNEWTQAEVRQEIIEADADLSDGCLNETLIRWIVDLNFDNVTDYPKLVTYARPKPDLKQQSEIDKTLVCDIGLPVGTRYFYSTYGIPQPEPDEDLVQPGALQTGTWTGSPEGAVRVPGTKEFSEQKNRKPAFTLDQVAIETLADAVLQETSTSLQSNEKRIVAAIASAGTYEEAVQNILDLYPEMDMDELAVRLERAAFNAHLYGRYVAEKGAK